MKSLEVNKILWRIDMDGDVRNLIRHFPPDLRQKVKASLRSIAEDPFLGKPLQQDLKGLYSYRIRSFRIIYARDVSRKCVHLITIGPRKTVYEDLEKSLRRS